MTLSPGPPIVRVMTVRTISYAPESIHGRYRVVRHPAWIVCRRQVEYAIEDDDALQRLARAGRIRPDDLVVNPSADSCVRAGELAQLTPIFRQAAIERLGRVSPLLARAMEVVWRLLEPHCS